MLKRLLILTAITTLSLAGSALADSKQYIVFFGTGFDFNEMIAIF